MAAIDMALFRHMMTNVRSQDDIQAYMSTEGRAADAIRRERDLLRLLLEVTNLLVSRRDLGDVLQGLSECLRRTVAHDYASVALFPADGPDAIVRLVVLDGARRPELEGRPISVSARHRDRFARGEPAIYDFGWLDRQNPAVAATLRPFGLRSFWSGPLTTARGRVGIINVASRRPAAFDGGAAETLGPVSGQVAIAVENGLAYERIQRLTDQIASEKRYLEDELRAGQDFTDIIGESEAVRRALQDVDTVAATDAAVLLTGETGTGKELVARAIHDRSPRFKRSFVRLNCAAIPRTLVESELFGHERGAFTGADAARAGRFEIADGGTIFLDEVGELPIDVQPKLLRVLQEQEFERLGGARTRRVDVRVVAATNRDLGAMVAAGEFREDLFYRLNVFPIRLPPLRERRDDVPVLVRHFVAKHARALGRALPLIPAGTMTTLQAWEWPGNVRELENVIERAVILARDGVLRVPSFDAPASRPPVVPEPAGGGRLVDVERAAILQALRAAGGLVGGAHGAAARLGLRRTTLHSRMRKLGIQRPSY